MSVVPLIAPDHHSDGVDCIHVKIHKSDQGLCVYGMKMRNKGRRSGHRLVVLEYSIQHWVYDDACVEWVCRSHGKLRVSVE